MVKAEIHGVTREYEEGTTYEKIAEDIQKEYDSRIALVYVNGKQTELIKKMYKDCSLSFVTYRHSAGHKTYVRTATLVLMKAVSDVLGMEAAAALKVEFAIGTGYYCSFTDGRKADEATVRSIKERMQQVVEGKLPILKTSYPLDEAIELFRKNGMMDKVALFKYRRSSFVNVYSIDDYHDYFYGHMLPHTGYVDKFDLTVYKGGLMLNLPTRENPGVLVKVEEREKLFATMKEASDWGRELGVETVGYLNDRICEGKITDLIMVQEALQERRMAEIAREIVSRRDVKFVMIAGPSSSGKTSFAHRLSIQLRTLGLSPHPIGVDDYFVNRDQTPLDENGNYNFECLEAIDIKQFNQDMCALLEGKQVQFPTFNFKNGMREYRGNYKKLEKGDILVIEGIHALNDKMSESLPTSSKFKIYISALTSMNIDAHNRIPTTDARLIRRMVRDARTRGTSAQGTIRMWPSVRRGEEENIFPYQESADAFFNSASLYELAVLKQFTEPLLYSIPKDDEEYYEAKRLLKFLEYYLGVSSENLPNNSIVREFVGGSCFNV
ncbi:MAG: nucleoside kinase [Lachnospiraceae bacterium]|nr:nucleoside kinase [Lachnospiraceae bacterium]